MVGVTYTCIVFRRTRRQTSYEPVQEDWIWYIALPLVAYAALVAGAIALGRDVLVPLFVVGAASLLLLFVGIHNAWDTVTYLVIDHQRQRAERE